MSTRVWKFALPAPDVRHRSFVTMPTDSEPLSVDVQNGELVVWALVIPYYDDRGQQALRRRRFIIANTGTIIEQLPAAAKFLGSVTTVNGIVWHVWDGDAETTA